MDGFKPRKDSKTQFPVRLPKNGGGGSNVEWGWY